MRKKYFLFFIVIICLLCTTLITKNDNTKSVFNENVNNFNIYTLDISKEDINTNNLANYFDNIKILEIYPYINPIYKNNINLSNYKFNTILSNKKNISNFISKYLKIINNNFLKEEVVKYNLNGVKINRIRVYTSNRNINQLLNNYKIKIINKK